MAELSADIVNGNQTLQQKKKLNRLSCKTLSCDDETKAKCSGAVFTWHFNLVESIGSINIVVELFFLSACITSISSLIADLFYFALFYVHTEKDNI